MNSLAYVNTVLQDEKCCLIIVKDAEFSFWEHKSLGGFRINNINKDYFIITERRILYILKNKTITDSKYLNFSSINFNSVKDTITYIDENDTTTTLSLKSFRLDYEEIQEIKKALNHHD